MRLVLEWPLLQWRRLRHTFVDFGNIAKEEEEEEEEEKKAH